MTIPITVIWLQLLFCHLASKASSCLLLDRGGEKEVMHESRQAFEVALTQTSGLVNLVFSRQTGFFCASIRLLINRCS